MSAEPKFPEVPLGTLEQHDPEKSHPTSTSSSHHAVDTIEAKSDISDFPEGGARAWMVAAGTASILFCTLGYTNSFGIFQAYYMENQLRHETPDRIAWIGSLQSFLLFASGSVGGPLFDRYGPKVIWPAAILYIFAIMMTSLCKEYWQFMLAQGVLTGIANGLLMFPSMAATPQYFSKKRGAAMGIALAGSSLGGVIFPIALAKMLTESTLGFAWSMRICGFIMIPFLAFSCVAIRARLPPRDTSFFLLSPFRIPLFNTLIIAEFCLMIGMFSPLIFLPSFAIQIGVDPALASYLVAMLNGASIFGRILPGFLADRFGRLNMLAAAGATTGILVLVWPQVTGTAGVVAFAVFFGFCSGAIVSGGSVALSMCPEDPKETGTYLGQGMAFASLAALVGPPATGALLERYGGYVQISIFGGVLTLVGAALAFACKMATKKGLWGNI